MRNLVILILTAVLAGCATPSKTLKETSRNPQADYVVPAPPLYDVVWNSMNKGLARSVYVYWQMTNDPNVLHLKYFWASPSTAAGILAQDLGMIRKYTFLNKGSLTFDVKSGELKLDGKAVGVWNGHPLQNKGSMFFYGFTFSAPLTIDEGKMTISIDAQ